jgi:hypothetical protein
VFSQIGQVRAVTPVNTIFIIQSMHSINADQQNMANAVPIIDMLLRVSNWGHEDHERQSKSYHCAFLEQSLSLLRARV